MRSTRNTLLAAASAVGVVAGCVGLATQALVLADEPAFAATYREVGDVVGLVGAVALAAAFGVSWVGFVQGARESRARMLAIAAGLFAAYGASEAVGPLLELVNTPSEAPWKFLAADAAFAAHGVALLIAAALVARAVLSGSPGWVLGWASLLLAAQFALLATGYGFQLAFSYDFSPPGRVVGGLVAVGAGYFVAASAAFKAAIALATADSRRDRGLGISATVFAVGFLTAAAGFITLATLGAHALICLFATFPFVLAVAAGVGAAAFFSTREAPQF
jgi:hypothetical protein